MHKTLTFTHKTTCDLIFKKDLFSDEEFIDSLDGESYVFISDTNLQIYYEKKIRETFFKKKISYLFIPATEKSKSFSELNKLLEKLFLLGCTRKTVLIAFGGGVVLDLVGFLASIFLRGISVLYIPTTIIGMVDAAIGGKTGINTSFGKNLIGSFAQPKAIYIDPHFLKTLPQDSFKEGLSEMVKHALIADKNLFNIFVENAERLKNRDLFFIEKHLLTALAVKKQIVQEDTLDQGKRNLLNFGHTIGHGLEASLEYAITHGKAVCIGMVVESYISYKKGLLSKATFERIQEALKSFGLYFQIETHLDKAKFFHALFYDKKNSKNQVHIVLLKEIGSCLEEMRKHSFPISENELESAYTFMKKEFFC